VRQRHLASAADDRREAAGDEGRRCIDLPELHRPGDRCAPCTNFDGQHCGHDVVAVARSPRLLHETACQGARQRRLGAATQHRPMRWQGSLSAFKPDEHVDIAVGAMPPTMSTVRRSCTLRSSGQNSPTVTPPRHNTSSSETRLQDVRTGPKADPVSGWSLRESRGTEPVRRRRGPCRPRSHRRHQAPPFDPEDITPFTSRKHSLSQEK
jgi:hypothetical protein